MAVRPGFQSLAGDSEAQWVCGRAEGTLPPRRQATGRETSKAAELWSLKGCSLWSVVLDKDEASEMEGIGSRSPHWPPFT